MGLPPGRSKWLPHAELSAGMRIQIGGSSEHLPGWINTDINGLAEYYLDAVRPWPIRDGGVAYIYADNFIEHLTLPSARAFLSNARRALAPGGRIRLVTPDVETAARLYLEGGQETDAAMNRHRLHGYLIAHPVDLLRVAFAESGHWRGYMFDESSLRAEMSGAGFADVTRCHVSESTDPVLRGLEKRTEPIEDKLQLVLEGQAPSRADS
jgi:predicted SAM-dependent methyltransferase